MVTAKLYGGLGNQMFQIAAAEALAKRNNDFAIFDFDDCKVYHQGNPSNIYKNTLFKNIKSENTYFQNIKYRFNHMGSEYINITYQKDIMLDGYFQSEKYFSDQSEHIRHIFSFPEETVNQVNDFISGIGGQVTALHVRRGDYLRFQHVHPICNKEYFENAMNLLPTNNFIVISDDIEWCKNNFTNQNIHYSPGHSDLFDMCLISKCHNVIISNSSFGWWGAWLNDNPEKNIIAPRLWFVDRPYEQYKDIYTPNMILI